MTGRSEFHIVGIVFLLVVATMLSGCPPQSPRIVNPVAPQPVAEDFDYDVAVSSRRASKKATTSADKGASRNRVEVPRLHPEWVPKAPGRRWVWIVVHHSGTKRGNASMFDKYHRNNRRWDELGYHFVIGNGTDSGNGEVEIGSRWAQQKWGAHCKVLGHEEYNQFGIGICVVGNFNRTRPTAEQMKSLVELTRWLVWRYRIPQSHVIGHRDVKDTDCPGIHFPFGDFRRAVFGKERK